MSKKKNFISNLTEGDARALLKAIIQEKDIVYTKEIRNRKYSIEELGKKKQPEEKLVV